MKAIILNCTLKSGTEVSNTDVLAQSVIDELMKHDIETETIRVVNESVLPGVVSEAAGEGDGWPAIHDKIRAAEILIIATPTWVGHPSSVCQQVIERMDAMISEEQSEHYPAAYNKVAGIVVTGNEDGAHHVVAEVAQALIDIGFTVPGQAWTYWNMGPGPGPSYTETDHMHDWSERTGRTCARNLVAVAQALAAHPLPKLEA